MAFTEDQIERQSELIKVGKPPVPEREDSVTTEPTTRKKLDPITQVAASGEGFISTDPNVPLDSLIWTVYRLGELNPGYTLKEQMLALSLTEEARNFAVVWDVIYNTIQGPKKAHGNLSWYERNLIKPTPQQTSDIKAAVYVFGNDIITGPQKEVEYLGGVVGEQWGKKLIPQILNFTAAAETSFDPDQEKQNIGRGERPGRARSAWQLEPNTVISLAENSKSLFQKRFREKFDKRYRKMAEAAGYDGKHAVINWLASFGSPGAVTAKEKDAAGRAGYDGENAVGQWKISEIILKDGELAATFAIAVYIAGLQNLDNKIRAGNP